LTLKEEAVPGFHNLIMV